MTEYLIFRLYGPMASWGDIAVGEVRPTFTHPSKSAVLGLVAAALGVDRGEEERHRALTASYGFAVRVECMGVPLVDYHTVQVPPATGGRRRRAFHTRRDELTTVSRAGLSTILSRRDYRMDAAATAVLWARSELPAHALAEIVAALREPRYLLYLGRKSCPVALPLQPQVIEAESVREALARYASVESALPAIAPALGTSPLRASGPPALFWDEDAVAGVERQHTFERRDAILSRRRWQFDVRQEDHGILSDE